MLTPVFSCVQSADFVEVHIILSAICKAMEAAFDINGNQFTFYCSPYYLRLKFNEQLAEGKGERATYELENNTLTVYLPKENSGEEFTQLQNPAFLIATDKQRSQWQAQYSAEGNAEEDADDEEEEMEFVQTLHDDISNVNTEAEGAAPVQYGFGNHFTGLFKRLDADVVHEMVEVPLPDVTTAEERRLMRVQMENKTFDEESLLLCFEDIEGEVAHILRYVPNHIRDFQQALRSDNIVYASLPSAPREVEALEVEEETLVGDGKVELWRGNIGEFKKPLIEEIVPEPSAPQESSNSVPAASSALPAMTRLAIPRRRPELKFTAEENATLLRMTYPRLMFPPTAESVAALTADILFADAYDDLVTEGTGCSESLWNMVKLSPALSYLDPADNVYDACLFFARRALVYPLHRHFALVQRVFAVVGTRLLLGRQYVVRALLQVRSVLSHAEHKHLLCTIFLDPLIGYWMNAPDADSSLAKLALEIHEHATRKQPAVVSTRKPLSSALIVDHASSSSNNKRTLQPIVLMHLGLPFTEDE